MFVIPLVFSFVPFHPKLRAKCVTVSLVEESANEESDFSTLSSRQG